MKFRICSLFSKDERGGLSFGTLESRFCCDKIHPFRSVVQNYTATKNSLEQDKCRRACFKKADHCQYLTVPLERFFTLLSVCVFPSLRSCTDELTWPLALSLSMRSVRKSSTSPCRLLRRASASWWPVAMGQFPRLPFLVRKKQTNRFFYIQRRKFGLKIRVHRIK